jgi:hypothetical protein
MKVISYTLEFLPDSVWEMLEPQISEQVRTTAKGDLHVTFAKP